MTESCWMICSTCRALACPSPRESNAPTLTSKLKRPAIGATDFDRTPTAVVQSAFAVPGASTEVALTRATATPHLLNLIVTSGAGTVTRCRTARAREEVPPGVDDRRSWRVAYVDPIDAVA